MFIEKTAPLHVQIGVQASGWEDAIRKSSQTLLNSGAIEKSYKDKTFAGCFTICVQFLRE